MTDSDLTIELYRDNGGHYWLRAGSKVAAMHYAYDGDQDFGDDARAIREGLWSLDEYEEDGGTVLDWSTFQERYIDAAEATGDEAKVVQTQTAFRIFANGTDMGTYWGDDEENALDAYAQDAGYEDYEALADEHGDDAEAREATEA